MKQTQTNAHLAGATSDPCKHQQGPNERQASFIALVKEGHALHMKSSPQSAAVLISMLQNVMEHYASTEELNRNAVLRLAGFQS